LKDMMTHQLDIIYIQGLKIYKPTEGTITFTTLTTEKVVATFKCIVAETGNPANTVEITNGKVNVGIIDSEDGIPVGDDEDNGDGDKHGDGDEDSSNIFSFKINGHDFNTAGILTTLPSTDPYDLIVRAYGADDVSMLQLMLDTDKIKEGTHEFNGLSSELMIGYANGNRNFYSKQGEIKFTTLTKQRVVATFKCTVTDDIDSFEITDGQIDVQVTP